jgi:assimilatory nitrate reductase catalytic subunit
MTDIFPPSKPARSGVVADRHQSDDLVPASRIKKTLQSLEFLVVQDAYADVETTKYAHVYLPAALWGEKEGVFTNTERRVNLVRKVVEPHGDSRPDLWIFNQMAKRCEQGRKIRFRISQVFHGCELSRGRMLDYSGLDHDRIEKQRGVRSPAPGRRDRFAAPLHRRRVPAPGRQGQAAGAALRRQQQRPDKRFRSG